VSATYALALAVTLAVELPIVAAMARSAARRVVVDAALLNLVTHPLAALAFAAWGDPASILGPAFLGIEAAVVAAEAVGFRSLTGMSWPRAWAVSLAANLPTALLSLAPAAIA